jgi:calreticulin
LSNLTFFSCQDGEAWKNRWVVSKSKEAEGTAGQWGISSGKYFNDAEEDKGLQTTQDARFYQISSEIKEFSNKGKTLVLQFSIKHEQNIDCGGGYIKLLPAGLNQEQFNGDSDYNIMFGPDICGSTKRVHVIFNYKGKNHLISKEVRAESDTHTHLYTLIVEPDQTFKVGFPTFHFHQHHLLFPFL